MLGVRFFLSTIMYLNRGSDCQGGNKNDTIRAYTHGFQAAAATLRIER